MKFTPKVKKNLYTVLIALIIFTVTYGILIIFNLAPKTFQIKQSTNTQKSIFQSIGKEEEFLNDSNLLPEKVEIQKIGVSSQIEIPKTIDVTTLDSALSRGAVYYPGSGNLQKGNMFLFGHSTNWKVVNNQAYKTFNNLDKLEKNDEIEITSGESLYIYQVLSVYHATEDEVRIDFQKGERMLTISTCDTFGQKQDRWIVEAEFYKKIKKS